MIGLPLIGETRVNFENKLRAMAEAFEDARMGAGLSHKSIADEIGTDPSHLSQAVGHHGLNAVRLLLLSGTERGRRFLRIWVRAFVKAAGIADLLRDPMEDADLRQRMAALESRVEQLAAIRRTA